MRTHKSCGPKVAKLKALLIFSGGRIFESDLDRDDESMDAIVDGSKAFSCELIFLSELNADLKLASFRFLVRVDVVCSGAKDETFSTARHSRADNKMKDIFNICGLRFVFEMTDEVLFCCAVVQASEKERKRV